MVGSRAGSKVGNMGESKELEGYTHKQKNQ